MKRFFVVVLVFFLLFNLVGCTNSQDVLEKEVSDSGNTKSDNKDDSKVDSENDSEDSEDSESRSDDEEAENEESTDEENDTDESEIEKNDDVSQSSSRFVDIEPLYNVPNNKQFTIKLNLSDEPFASFQIEEYFRVYKDRECTERLISEVIYDSDSNIITIKPDETSWAMYPREDIDVREERNWGSLQTYYLLVGHDILATEVTELDKPIRMMFTIASPVDIPTVIAKPNSEGNITLYWEHVPEATEYKVYYGTEYGMRELSTTEDNKFALTEDRNQEYSMNTLLSDVYDYAVTAVNGSEESRLSNIIKGEDYIDNAPMELAWHEENNYTWDDVDSIMELPTNVDVNVGNYISEQDMWVTKSCPVVWDFRNPIIDDYGFREYEGKVVGTTFKLKFLVLDRIPTEEEILEFENSTETVANAIATDTTERIKVQNGPSNNDISDETHESDLTSSVEESSQELKEDLETALAKGMLNHETNIDLSLYAEAGDGAHLSDVLQKVLIQYPLILDESYIDFDFRTKTLTVEYSSTKEEVIKKQKEIQDRVKSIVASVIEPGMTLVEKERALHDWLTDNSEYHKEILDAYMNGENLNAISEIYGDSFNPYGVLINGVGVCQSYAEAYKLLCEEANVPCIVVTGNLSSIPHAWNKVKLEDAWYHVDVTNNDGDGSIPYAVFNTSDTLTSSDFTMDKYFAIDSELQIYTSDKNDKDYYFVNGSFAESEEQLLELFEEGMKNGKDFYVKVVPSINNETIGELLSEAFNNYGTQDQNPKYGKAFNIIFVIY